MFLRSQMLTAQLPTKKDHLQKKFEIILQELKIDTTDLKPTQRVVELYHNLMNEALKMFALQNYIKKKMDELSVIKEFQAEKKSFMEIPKQQYKAVMNSH